MTAPNTYLKCTIAYEGSRYFGWQKTGSGPSIQESLEKALFQITGHTTKVEAASRTDRGVHARGQVVHFSSLYSERLHKQLNGVLPYDIRVMKIEKVPAEFHATLSAKSKEYHYLLCLGAAQSPIHRRYAWHFPYSLSLNDMRYAAQSLIGTHDFSAFANERDEQPMASCSRIELIPLEEGQRLQIQLQANRFLYKMARNLVGTLAYIGCGKLPLDVIPTLLATKDRKQAGITAPAHGLYLSKVFYD